MSSFPFVKNNYIRNTVSGHLYMGNSYQDGKQKRNQYLKKKTIFFVAIPLR